MSQENPTDKENFVSKWLPILISTLSLAVAGVTAYNQYENQLKEKHDLRAVILGGNYRHTDPKSFAFNTNVVVLNAGNRTEVIQSIRMLLDILTSEHGELIEEQTAGPILLKPGEAQVITLVTEVKSKEESEPAIKARSVPLSVLFLTLDVRSANKTPLTHIERIVGYRTYLFNERGYLSGGSPFPGRLIPEGFIDLYQRSGAE